MKFSRCTGTPDPLCLLTKPLYNAVHEGKIIACHIRFELQQKFKLGWCVYIGIRLIPIGNFDTGCVTTTNRFNWICERQFLNIVVDCSHLDAILSSKASNRHRTMAAQRTPDCYPPFMCLHAATAFLVSLTFVQTKTEPASFKVEGSRLCAFMRLARRL